MRIGGKRIADVYVYIKQNITNPKPNVVSFLVGMSDARHEMEWQNGVASDMFKKIHRMMIDEIREVLPNIKIILLEPFTLEGAGTREYFVRFQVDVSEKAETARQIAEEYDLPFVALQEDLNRLAE